MESHPRYILFAGINGAGKSTLFRSGIWPHKPDDETIARINSDEILVEHGWDPADRRAQIRATKEAIRRMQGLFARRESFNLETMLSGSTIMRSIRNARLLGYEVALHYIGLEEPRLALERIANRVKRGGHAIPHEDVLRRAASSGKNLREALPLCNETYLYDNTEALRLVAGFSLGKPVVLDEHAEPEWIRALMQ